METSVNASQALRQKRDELYRAARDDPGSPEDGMVEILLLSAMSKMDPVPYDATAGQPLGDERQHFQARRSAVWTNAGRRTRPQAREVLYGKSG